MFEKYYGLTGKPFQLTPDPQFYFESLTHRKALSYLGYGLAQGEGFIVITGEVGAGKSTLVEHLVATSDPSRLTVGKIVTSRLNEEEIVHVIAQSFGLDIDGHDKASALGAIEAFLHDEARAGHRCLLVVDESQNLSVEALEELRMLSNFQLGAHPLLQTLLLGQPEFRATLQGHPRLEQLRQRVIASHHLEAMQEDEVQRYVEHRLARVGWNGLPSFDAAVFSELYDASGGIPRRINVIVNRLLLLGAVEQCAHIDADMLRSVVAELQIDGGEPEPEETQVEYEQQHIATVMERQLHVAKEAGSTPQAHVDTAIFEAMLAERDAMIAELQQAVIELSQAQEIAVAGGAPALTDLAARLDALDARITDQESAIRHTLNMLIEWIESDGLKPIAA
ncbi:MAG: general secretion pathway protein [Rhodocyclaceae bacterium]|nr:MAG: general secretion pathway protein [Rhodocyclaceae bacterium]